jgi:3-deoxy-D-arabino-heptulosonate 7-phosphate (DAHP) synthase class II
MKKLTRPSSGVEELQIANCPCCDGEVQVGDCGYSSFNPGYAECENCERKWSFSCVRDSWEAGQLWNDLAQRIRHKLEVLSWIGVKASQSIISRDFAAEKLQDEAKVLLKEFEETVIGADKPKSR